MNPRVSGVWMEEVVVQAEGRVQGPEAKDVESRS